MLLESVKSYFIEKYPEEACGFIVGNEFFPVENIAEDKTKAFEISKEDNLKYLLMPGVKFVHSHPDWWPVPSELDMRQQMATNIPWGIVSVRQGSDMQLTAHDIVWFGDCTKPDDMELLGRPFIHGVSDCYETIRDWWRVNRGILLPQFPRDWEWWSNGGDLYTENFAKAGFRAIDPRKLGVKAGDVPLCKLRSTVINHGGVYVGDGLWLHHVTARDPYDPSRVSKRDPIARYQPMIDLWLRHETDL